MENKEKLFRKKSLDKISSPEELDKYIKTASPSIVILFISILVLLAGFLVWGFVGRIETKSNIGFALSDSITTTYIKDSDYQDFLSNYEDLESLNKNVYMEFDNFKVSITNISNVAYLANEDANNDLLKSANIQIGESYYIITGAVDCTVDGFYKGKIVYSSISPLSLIF